VVRSHHERWDGTGYPDHLAGEEIPLAARVFAVADMLDALTTDRPYRPATSMRYAREMIASESGEHFDPRVVDAFNSIDDRVFERIAAEIR
jgi:ribonuclease P protein subunit RPR2